MKRDLIAQIRNVYMSHLWKQSKELLKILKEIESDIK
jgi:hypothetical protein